MLRTTLIRLVGIAALVLTPLAVRAQSYPSKP